MNNYGKKENEKGKKKKGKLRDSSSKNLAESKEQDLKFNVTKFRFFYLL